MSVNIDEFVVAETITRLQIEGRYSVKKLADELNVSRQYLYANFKSLLPDTGPAATKEKILNAILVLQARSGKTKQKISDVATEAGIQRQTLSNSYKELYPYILGERPVPATVSESREAELERMLAASKQELSAFKEKEERRFIEFRDTTYTTLMKKDIEYFNSINEKLNLDDLQTQNDELVRLNKRYINEIHTLRAEINSVKKEGSKPSSCEIIAHLAPDYSVVSDAGADAAGAMKALLKVERQNFRLSLDRATELKPDRVVFFQPFFSCDFDAVPVLPCGGSVLVIESNIAIDEDIEELVEKLNCEVVAVYADSVLASTKMHCRRSCLRFGDEFIELFYKKRSFPALTLGFDSVVGFKP